MIPRLKVETGPIILLTAPKDRVKGGGNTMRIERTGKIADDFYVAGNASLPVYVLDGAVPVLFDGGVTAFSYAYERDIKKILGDRSPVFLFITHAHFDHIGAVRHLKSVWPDMRIACSETAGEILERPGAVKVIRELNRNVLWGLESSKGMMRPDEICREPFESFKPDLAVSDGEIINLGGAGNVEAMAAPGHTRDFMSYWIPERNILVASEAVGCDDGSGYIVSEFLVDYDAYLQSLRRLSVLAVHILCPGHRLVLTGRDAKRHMAMAPEYAKEYAAMVEKYLRAEKWDVERTVKRIKKVEWDEKPWPKQIEPAYVLNTRARVKTLLDRIRERGFGLAFT